MLSATLFAAIVVDILIFPVPSNDTPEAVTSPAREISLPVAKAVAVAALPVHEPDEPLVFPLTFPVKLPTKLVVVKAPVLELKAKILP